jgi:uncharacterized membrane protein YdbT with pleckstrin-like domain
MGNYIKESLLADEIILHEGNPHWSYVLKYYLFCAILLVLAVITFIYGRQYQYFLLNYLCLTLLFIDALMYILSCFIRNKTVYAITSTRIIQKTGILDITVIEIPLFKVETVNLTQSFGQRLINTGNIELVGSGGTNLRLTYVSKPTIVRNIIIKALNNFHKNEN